MKKQVWKSGPPPSVGWWPASCFNDVSVIRWWNGRYWSADAYRHMSAYVAAERAEIRSVSPNNEIEWRDRPKSWLARSKT